MNSPSGNQAYSGSEVRGARRREPSPWHLQVPPGHSLAQDEVRLASAAGALADAEVASRHDVRAISKLLGFASMEHRPFSFLLLSIHFCLLQQSLLLGVVGKLSGHGLAALLCLCLLLVEVPGINDANNLSFVGQADRCWQDQALGIFDPAHLLEDVDSVRNIGDGSGDLWIGQLDLTELVFRWVARHIAGELLDDVQRLRCLGERQCSQGLLQRSELVRYLVPWRISSVSHFCVGASANPSQDYLRLFSS
mmetsp:Transcript_90422/g.161093  ORF Transcript_90422/g.161093 Transcript_90422/m.161093 type:complete len:251 (+) Transcript_90422:97-849(+)